MARMMSRSRPVVEGQTGLKFSEIVVIILAIAAIVMGVRWYLDYRHSATATLQEFLAAVKAGNIGNQYALLDEQDKKNYFPTQQEYGRNTLAHGYTERLENVTLAPEEKDPKNPNKVTIAATVSIRDTAQGKQLYEAGSAGTYTDHFVMHKNADGNWRVVLSASVDKSTHQLNLQKATPSPESVF